MRFIFFLIFWLIPLAGSIAQQRYTIQELPVSKRYWLNPYAINDRGDIAGYCFDEPDDETYVFISRPGLGVSISHDNYYFPPRLLNQQGDLFFHSEESGHPVVQYDSQNRRSIAFQVDGLIHSANDCDQFVFGPAPWSNTPRHEVFVFDHGVRKPLTALFGESFSWIHLNNRGELLSTVHSGRSWLRYYNLASGYTYDLTLQGDLAAIEINDRGDWLFLQWTGEQPTLIYWPQGGKMQTFPLPDYSRWVWGALNDKGQFLISDTHRHLCKLLVNDQLVDVTQMVDFAGTAFIQILYLHDLNNHGQLVGMGLTHDGHHRAILLNPPQ